jgi:hypothetical protein
MNRRTFITLLGGAAAAKCERGPPKAASAAKRF